MIYIQTLHNVAFILVKHRVFQTRVTVMVPQNGFQMRSVSILILQEPNLSRTIPMFLLKVASVFVVSIIIVAGDKIVVAGSHSFFVRMKFQKCVGTQNV